MKRLIKAASVAVTFALLGGTLVGCSSGPAAQALFCATDAEGAAPSATDHAIVVVGNVAGAPAWSMTEQARTAVSSVLETGGRVDVVSTGGDGYLCAAEAWGQTVPKDSANPKRRNDVRLANLALITEQLTRAPREDGSDAYAALHLAADQFDSVGASRQVLVFLGSGLNDHGDLDWTTGLLGSEPDEVVSALKHLGPLPNLKGITVIVTGLGWTAPDQEPLNDRLRGNVEDTYARVLSASGTKATIDPAPHNGAPIDTLGHTVNPTPVPVQGSVPPPESCAPFEQVFDQTSALRFKGDKATFVDPDAARDVLTPIAHWLADDPANREVAIVGTTARATSKANQKKLSLARARAAAKLLVSLGAEPGQVTKVTGAGSWFDGYVNDLDPAGGLLPGPAARNRSVRLSLEQNC